MRIKNLGVGLRPTQGGMGFVYPASHPVKDGIQDLRDGTLRDGVLALGVPSMSHLVRLSPSPLVYVINAR